MIPTDFGRKSTCSCQSNHEACKMKNLSFQQTPILTTIVAWHQELSKIKETGHLPPRNGCASEAEERLILVQRGY